MKVLQFYRTYLPETQGGLEEAIRQICLGTTPLGVEHRVLSMARVKRTERLQRPEAEVIRVPMQLEPASCSMGVGMFGEFKRQSDWADIVHIHYPWPFADLVHLLSGCRKPVVVTYHSDIIRQSTLERLYSPLRSAFFNRVSAFVATSPNYVKTSIVLRRLPVKPEIIPLGLCDNSYMPPSKAAVSAVARNYGEGFFLFVGVLRYYKGLHNLVRAASMSGLPVVIAGDGPERQYLERLACELGCKNVKFTGYVDDDTKQALYRSARAVVFPSCERSEAFGVTLLEGQLHKKPLITCEIGTGTSYVNLHEQTGLVVMPNDPSALASAMRTLWNDSNRAETMGVNGWSRMQTLFSGQEVGKQYKSIYERLA